MKNEGFISGRAKPRRIEIKKDVQGCEIENEIDILFIKDEEHRNGEIVGPLFAGIKGSANRVINYKNGMKSFSNGFFAKWYSYSQALKISKKLNVTLEEC